MVVVEKAAEVDEAEAWGEAEADPEAAVAIAAVEDRRVSVEVVVQALVEAVVVQVLIEAVVIQVLVEAVAEEAHGVVLTRV